MFLYSYFFDSETRYLLNNYPTSPVPIIWLVRLIIKEVISQNIYPYARFKGLNFMIDKCSKGVKTSETQKFLKNFISWIALSTF